jgi:hypothetical protein
MTTFRDNPYRWQLRSLVNAIQRYDHAIDSAMHPANPAVPEDLDRLYFEMIGEVEMSVLILGGQEMINETIGNA